MVKVRAFIGIDMHDFSTTYGTVSYADADLLVVGTGATRTWYHGEFTYPAGQWRGEINKMEVLRGNKVVLSVSGLDLPTRDAQAGRDTKKVFKKALAGEDKVVGSRSSDVLDGFGGDDNIRGGLGADRIFGGDGRDVLVGGKGRDVLVGGDGRDVFRFGARDGKDTIRDFEDGRDKIELSRAVSFRDLEFDDARNGASVAFGGTEIVLRGIDAEDLGRGDFLFA
tara:strand:- start:235 stop:906 length:672 start_codon:yes stop_codon:yes gene_type:complete